MNSASIALYLPSLCGVLPCLLTWDEKIHALLLFVYSFFPMLGLPLSHLLLLKNGLIIDLSFSMTSNPSNVSLCSQLNIHTLFEHVCTFNFLVMLILVNLQSHPIHCNQQCKIQVECSFLFPTLWMSFVDFSSYMSCPLP